MIERAICHKEFFIFMIFLFIVSLFILALFVQAQINEFFQKFRKNFFRCLFTAVPIEAFPKMLLTLRNLFDHPAIFLRSSFKNSKLLVKICQSVKPIKFSPVDKTELIYSKFSMVHHILTLYFPIILGCFNTATSLTFPDQFPYQGSLC